MASGYAGRTATVLAGAVADLADAVSPSTEAAPVTNDAAHRV